MSEADIKLRIIRLIVSQEGEVLQEIYQMILNKLYKERAKDEPLSAMERSYREMSEDKEREEEALGWIEGTLNSEEL